MIKAVIFDMDGVLTDTEPVINAAAIAGLKEYGVHAEPVDFHPFVGMGEDRYIGGVAEKYGVDYDPAMKTRVYEIYLDILPRMVTPIAGVRELVLALRDAAVPVAVATSADEIKMKANLEAVDLPLDWFATLVTGEDVQHKKPHPEIYVRAAAKLSIEPNACCVVEDATNGVKAAKAANMRCVAVESSFAKDELEEAGADCVRRTIADVTLSDLNLTTLRTGGC
ncbi:MAG: HAD-IA family hydrolase [Candidatus Pacebacteria bacterium]|nr:HAD-IA family hydrolase [Candidatus Paceibacterota bacterium]